MNEQGPKKTPTNPGDRPRLSERKEARLAEADAKSAAGYAALEAAGEKVEALAEVLDSGKVEIAVTVDESLIHVIGTEKNKG